MKRVLACLSMAISVSFQSGPALADPLRLDALAGDYAITDAMGQPIGWAKVSVRLPEAMIEETRRIGDQQPQLLWFASLEHNQGWTQLFLSPNGIREFKRESEPGVWPLVLGAEIKLADGSPARFRLTITPDGSDAHRRELVLSKDGGASWQMVLDYRYRRTIN